MPIAPCEPYKKYVDLLNAEGISATPQMIKAGESEVWGSRRCNVIDEAEIAFLVYAAMEKARVRSD